MNLYTIMCSSVHADIAQLVEHTLGKGKVVSSILTISTILFAHVLRFSLFPLCFSQSSHMCRAVFFRGVSIGSTAYAY